MDPLTAIAAGTALFGSGGLFGKSAGGGLSKEGLDIQKRGMELEEQKHALEMAAAYPQLQLFTQFGIPTYQSAMQGLMSSYGYRPYSAPVTTGSTVGQRDVLTPAAAAPTTAEGARAYMLEAADRYGMGDYKGDYSGSGGPFGQQVIDYLRSMETPGATPGATSGVATPAAGTTPGAAPTGGEWGVSATLRSQFGATADKWARAKAAYSRQAQQEGLSPAMIAEGLRRLEMEESNEMRTLELTAKREGPLAVMGALGPALTAPAGISGGGTLAGIGQNLYTAGAQKSAAQQTAMGQIGGAIGNILARQYGTTTLPGTGGGAAAPNVPTTVNANPISLLSPDLARSGNYSLIQRELEPGGWLAQRLGGG